MRKGLLLLLVWLGCFFIATDKPAQEWTLDVRQGRVFTSYTFKIVNQNDWLQHYFGIEPWLWLRESREGCVYAAAIFKEGFTSVFYERPRIENRPFQGVSNAYDQSNCDGAYFNYQNFDVDTHQAMFFKATHQTILPLSRSSYSAFNIVRKEDWLRYTLAVETDALLPQDDVFIGACVVSETLFKAGFNELTYTKVIGSQYDANPEEISMQLNKKQCESVLSAKK